MIDLIDYLISVESLIAILIGFFYKIWTLLLKLKEHKYLKQTINKLDKVDVLFTYLIEFLTPLFYKKDYKVYAKLIRLVNTLNSNFKPDLIGIVKTNGIEKLIIDQSKSKILQELSVFFGTSIFEDADADMRFNEGLYIPFISDYEKDQKFAAELSRRGVYQCYVVPFFDESGFVSAYLFIGFTKALKEVDDKGDIKTIASISKEEFSKLKLMLENLKINFSNV